MNETALVTAVARALADLRSEFEARLAEMRAERSAELSEIVRELQTGLGVARASASEAFEALGTGISDLRSELHAAQKATATLVEESLDVARTLSEEDRLHVAEKLVSLAVRLDSVEETVAAHREALTEAVRRQSEGAEAVTKALASIGEASTALSGRVEGMEFRISHVVESLAETATLREVAESVEIARADLVTVSRLEEGVAASRDELLERMNRAVASQATELQGRVDEVRTIAREATEAVDSIEALLSERVTEVWRTIKDVVQAANDTRSELSALEQIREETGQLAEVAHAALSTAETAELIARESGVSLKEALAHLQDNWTNPSDWMRGGAGYQANAVVSHAGGVWASLTATKEEPGRGDDWRLVVDSVVDVTAEPDPVDRTRVNFVQRMASGRLQRSSVPLPLPNYLGTWEKDREYDHLDSVVFGDSRWLKTVAGPIGEPGKDDGWAMVGKHGPRGRPGEARIGPPGAPGESPEMDDILTEFHRFAEARGLFHSVRWGGDWVYGREYDAMSLVRSGSGLYLATQDGATGVPSDPRSSGWQCIISDAGAR